ncbi:MAG: hypothetical protein GTO04_18710, partial [Planctomycetales bacterium]|nr:hypothetical protein [Planctomycetales bacterium]
MCDRRCERAGDACPFWCFDWWLLLVVGLGMLAVHPRCVRMLTSLLGRVLRREPLPVTLSYPIALG